MKKIKLNHKLVRKTYKTCWNTIELIFLKVLILKKCEETSTECSLCKFYYFLDENLKYGPCLYDGCYDMSMKANSMQNLAIINHNGNHYRVNFAFMSKKDVYSLIKNAIIMGEKETL